jgi:hypothetical protein
MKLAVLVLPLVAACQASGSGDYPIGPGGGGPVVISGSGGGDAGNGGGAGLQIDGRVCLLTDLRHMTGCSDSGADGLVVALAVGSPQTVKVTAVTTDGAGHFSIVPPLCTDCTWRVTSTTDQRIVRSLMPFGTDPTIPVIGFDAYNTLLGANGQVIADQGSIVVRAVSGAAPAAQVAVVATTLTLDVALPDAVFYDRDTSKDLWNQTATQSNGVAWLPLVPLSPSPSPTTSGTLTLARQGGGSVTTTATILSNWITFLTTDIP